MTLTDSQITQLLTSAYPSVDPPQDLFASLLADLQQASPDPARRTFPRLSRPRWLAAACVLLIPCLVLALYVATQHNRKPVPTPALAQQNPRSPATPSPDRAYVPLDWDVEASSLVVAGKIEKVQEGVHKEKTTVYDGGILRISEVLKDAAADPAIKPGGTITVHVLPRYPDAFAITAGDEGIWVLHRNGTLVTPEMRLESTRRQEIADMVARQAIEQAANKDRVLREWAAHEAAFKAPAYGVQQLEADIKRGPDPSLPPESLRAVMVQDSNGTRGWVFIDSRGKVALATPYHAIMWSGFSNGLAPVATTVTKDSNLKDAGYIDPTGKLAIAPIYDGCEPFKDGLAVVYKNHQRGLIDPAGKEVLPCVYRSIWAYTADVVIVERDGEAPQLVDRTGKVILSGVGTHMSEGLIPVNVPAGSIPTTLPAVHSWADRWVGFANTKGQFVVDMGPLNEKGIHVESRGFHEGLMTAKQGNRWGYVAADATLAIAPKFLDAQDFSEGLAAATEGTDPHRPQWGYIDKRGEYVIPPSFEQAHSFSEGLAAVRMSTWVKNPEIPGAVMHALRWAYVDKQGKMVIGPFFDSANNFEKGLAFVYEGSRFGFIDKSGQYVWWSGNYTWWADRAAGK